MVRRTYIKAVTMFVGSFLPPIITVVVMILAKVSELGKHKGSSSIFLMFWVHPSLKIKHLAGTEHEMNAVLESIVKVVVWLAVWGDVRSSLSHYK